MEYNISQLLDIRVLAFGQYLVAPPQPAPLHEEMLTFSCGICHIPTAGSVHMWHGPHQ